MALHKLKLITVNKDYPIQSQSIAGVSISDKQNIPAGAIITTQSAADSLRIDSSFTSKKARSHSKLLSIVQ